MKKKLAVLMFCFLSISVVSKSDADTCEGSQLIRVDLGQVNFRVHAYGDNDRHFIARPNFFINGAYNVLLAGGGIFSLGGFGDIEFRSRETRHTTEKKRGVQYIVNEGLIATYTTGGTQVVAMTKGFTLEELTTLAIERNRFITSEASRIIIINLKNGKLLSGTNENLRTYKLFQQKTVCLKSVDERSNYRTDSNGLRTGLKTRD